ncbi:peptide/nickel transport system permease protein [Spinactinospora alkalitolerans]|uniref:Peptide/nickel transport system permease protein n=1 Tax=Spinactinospora alkalitolerans TaxID=687207 RepID=A0A852U1W8_9ACTN|nr:ABC transporter permease [Spinactinospora alkalitolerans]NYE47980.1 peptide/nickel transport system permease protein [Spinactinospora alkalitolerans]
MPGADPQENGHDTAAPSGEERLERVRASHFVAALVRDPITLISLSWLVLVVVTGLGAAFFAPYDAADQDIARRLLPPLTHNPDGGFHLLGTDQNGRDVLSMLLFGGRVSVTVALLGTLASGLLGVTIGLLAGYYGGRFDAVVMRIVDGMMSIPSLLLALFVLFIIGGGFLNVVLVFALLRWMIYARIARAQALSYRESAFVDAAHAIGAPTPRILVRHLLPNMASPLLVLATLEVSYLILTEASLSFLGFGIQRPLSSWGLMITQGRDYIGEAWWLVTIPGLIIFFTALGLNLLSSWARTMADPAQRWRWMKNKPSSRTADSAGTATRSTS